VPTEHVEVVTLEEKVRFGHGGSISRSVESDPEGDMLGVTRQVTDCRALAERRGWRVPMDTMGSWCGLGRRVSRRAG